MIRKLYLYSRSCGEPTYIALFLALLCLTIPLSTTGKSVSLVLALIAILYAPQCRVSIYASLRAPWCLTAIGLFLIACLACFWGPERWPEQAFFIDKYSKLLYLPILAAGFRDQRSRRWSISAIIISMLITATISYMKYIKSDYLGSYFIDPDPSAVFRNHIMTSYMMSFAAYLSGVRLISRTFIYDRVIYMLVYIIFTLHVLLINTSTTGYVVYFLLMGLWFVQHTSRMQMLLGAIFLTAILSLGLIYSNVMYVKASQTISELKIFHTSNKPKLRNTSLGYRMQFHAYAKKLYLRHPWIGNGTGSFTRLYAIEGPIPAWSWRLTEPHSQYWLVASEWGLLGCLGLFAFFLSLFFAAFRLTNMRSTAIALLISFMACCLTDSFLLYSGTGYFFILMMALCLGEY